MAKTLAELRAEGRIRLPRRSIEICLAQDLVARAQVLDREKSDLLLELGTADDGKRPTRTGDPRQARIAEINAELQALYADMREQSGNLDLQGISPGAWMQWREANPARVTGRDDNGRPIIDPIDEHVAYGLCDASALLADLKRYVSTYNGEPVDDEGWQFIAENAAPGDIKKMCRNVVEMHEGEAARAPKASLIGSSEMPTSETA